AFVNDLIVTPPTIGRIAEGQSDVAMNVKRNLTKDFDGIANIEAKIPLKKVKIEKE
ncbi:hypothetical protein A2U01_0026231, partial [Trifolium medium]|nr:hypothetical protein [Trifolium medium]